MERVDHILELAQLREEAALRLLRRIDAYSRSIAKVDDAARRLAQGGRNRLELEQALHRADAMFSEVRGAHHEWREAITESPFRNRLTLT